MKKLPSIFKEKQRLVGGLLPQPLVDKFSLICLYQNKSRSTIVTELITEYIIISERKGSVEEKYIPILASKFYNQVKKDKKISMSTMLKQVGAQLKRRKLNPTHIRMILTLVKKLYLQKGLALLNDNKKS